MDEAGVTTVLETPKVVAKTVKKQIGQCVSAERGELVTSCGIITASGGTLPPIYTFPRIRMKDEFMRGCPEGAEGFCSKSGWMTAAIFVKVLHYIQKHT